MNDELPGIIVPNEEGLFQQDTDQHFEIKIQESHEKSEERTYFQLFSETFHNFYNPVKDEVGTFITSFIGVSILALLQFNITNDYYVHLIASTKTIVESSVQPLPPFMMPSVGAASVLLFGQIDSPLAQPRNAIFGQIISAICGVTVRQIFCYCQHDCSNLLWLQCSFAVSCSILLMQLIGTVHPPGGATALSIIIGGPMIDDLGYWYVLTPVTVATLILVSISVLFQSAVFGRRYPHYWWKSSVK
jgi:CBS-domain-containing membrane protein